MSGQVPNPFDRFGLEVDSDVANYSLPVLGAALKPVIATRSDGSFFLAWSKYNGSYLDIYGQMFAADGAPAPGGPVTIAGSGQTEGLQAIAALADGRYAIAYSATGVDDPGANNFFGVFVRIYDPSDGALSASVQVNTQVVGSQSHPDIAPLADGGFVVTWQDHNSGGSIDVQGQLFNASGAKVGTEFEINTHGPGDHRMSSVVGLADGEHVVVWQSRGQEPGNGFGYSAFGQRFDANWQPLGGEFQIDDATDGVGAAIVDVFALSDGGFIALYQSGQVYMRRFDTEGIAIGPVTPISAGGRPGGSAKGVELADGAFVIVWVGENDAIDEADILARIFEADGTPRTDDFVLNGVRSEEQVAPEVAALPDGGYVVTWQSKTLETGQFADPWSVMVARYPGDGSGARAEPITLIEGDDLDNVINGTPGRDEIFGYGGSDSIWGMAGDDFIDGGDGDDSLGGSDGKDTVIGGAGDDRIYGGDGFDRLEGNAGNDRLQGQDGNDHLEGGDGDDELHGQDGADTLLGGPGNDILIGDVQTYRGGSDILDGGAGDDQLFGGFGNNVFTGGSGADLFFGRPSELDGDRITDFEPGDVIRVDLTYGDPSSVIYNAGSGELDIWLGSGSSGRTRIDLTLPAGLDPDAFRTFDEDGGVSYITIPVDKMVTGSSGDDILEGGFGDDVITGGAGNDTIDGRQSSDVAIYSGNRSDYHIVAPEPGLFIVSDLNAGDGNDGTDTLTGIETLRFADQDVDTATFPVGGLTVTDDDQSVTNTADMTGNPAVALIGDRITFTNQANLAGVTGPDYATAVNIVGADNTFITAAGGTIRFGHDGVYGRVTGTTTIRNEGTLHAFGDGIRLFGGNGQTHAATSIVIENAGLIEDFADIFVTGDYLSRATWDDLAISFTNSGVVEGRVALFSNDTTFDNAAGGVIGEGDTVYHRPSTGVDLRGMFDATNAGRIVAGDTGVKLTADRDVATPARFVNQATGVIGEDADGVTIPGTGVRSGDGVDITNHGVISGKYWGVVFSGFSLTNEQTGIIRGGLENASNTVEAAVHGTEGLELVNRGLVEGDVVITSSEHRAATITNTGTIDGDVEMGRGDDVFTGTGGTVTGTITGGAGDDRITGGAASDTAVYSGSRGGYTIVVDADGTVRVIDANGSDGDDGADTLIDIELLQFADQTVDLSQSVPIGLLIDQDGQMITATDNLSGDPAVLISGSDNSFVNDGATITGLGSEPSSAAVHITGSGNTIHNANGGTITSAQLAISGSGFADTVINGASIVGDVVLGGGDDILIHSVGTIDGDVDLGAGDDAALIDLDVSGGFGAITGTLTAGEGEDVFGVSTSGLVTFDLAAVTLPSGFEHLGAHARGSAADLRLTNSGPALDGPLVVFGEGAITSNVAIDAATAPALLVRDSGDLRLVNAASISGSGRGVDADSSVGVTITNRGTIEALSDPADATDPEQSAVHLRNGTLVNETGGIIRGTDHGVFAVNSATIENHGLIEATAATGHAILTGYGGAVINHAGGVIVGDVELTPQPINFFGGDVIQPLSVVNAGHIDGDVIFGEWPFGPTNSPDVYDGQGGTITGTVFGGRGNDDFTGGSGSETFEGGLGDDTLRGGAGSDTARFSGVAADYQVTENTDGTVIVTDLNTADGDEGTDTLTGVEHLQFSDQIFDVAPVGQTLLLNDNGSTFNSTEDWTGAPAVEIAGNNNIFVNQGGTVLGTGFAGNSGPGVLITGADNTVHNMVGGLITAASDPDQPLPGEVAIEGSAFTDFVINEGRIDGEINLGQGDDQLTLVGDGHVMGVVNAGVGGIDTLVLDDLGTDIRDLSEFNNFERLINQGGNAVVSGVGGLDEVRAQGGLGDRLVLLDSISPNSVVFVDDFVEAGIGGGTTVGQVTGTDAPNFVSIFDTVLGDVLLGAGDDVLTLGYSVSASPSVGGVIDGGEGQDRLDLSFGAGTGPVDLAEFNGFEILSVEASSVPQIVLRNASAFQALQVTGGSVRLEDTGAGLVDVFLFPDAADGPTVFDLAAGTSIASLSASTVAGPAQPTTTALSVNNAGIIGGPVQLSRWDDVLDTRLGRIDGPISAREGDDTVVGSGRDDVIDGGIGDDLLIGGAGADTLIGGAGVDTASYADAAGAVTVSLATGTGGLGEAGGDTLDGIENLVGSAFDDVFKGDGEDNRLEGGAGDDILSGGLMGADSYIGGTGSDTASYAYAPSGVAISLMSGIGGRGEAVNDSFDSIENLIGSYFDDDLKGDNGANRLDGGHGNDVLIGGAGDDVLIGGNGVNLFLGGAGIDTADYSTAPRAFASLTSGTGAGGQDTFDSIENLTGSAFDDGLKGDAGVNRLDGGAGDDLVMGEGGNDVVIGAAGDDVLMGGLGADQLDGGEGADTASYERAGASVSASLLSGRGGLGEAGGDTLIGIENIIGSDFDDAFKGDAGANRLDGGAGNDLLIGAGGDDTLIGGDGADVFVFSTGQVGAASILDFEPGSDTIDLAGLNLSGAADLTISADGPDTLVTVDDTLSITLVGVQPEDVDDGSFVF